ncbi:MAG: GIY-YIG nuclease family protein [bacterium]|nr:GIY-YIG nuclease family protein [bacterium]
MFYVYILKSKHHNELYVGSTNDLQRRFCEHNNGKEISTRRYMPWFLVYYEAFLEEKLARERESRLKHNGNARHELYQRIGLKKSGLPSTTFIDKSGAGFTLIELLIGIVIVTMITVMAVPNFRQAMWRNELRSGADEIIAQMRSAQNMSLAGKTAGFCNGGVNDKKPCQADEGCPQGLCVKQVPLGGYGVRFNQATPQSFIVFADLNNNHFYDPEEDLLNSPLSVPSSVVINALLFSPLDIVFEPPNARLYINGVPTGQATLVLRHIITNNTVSVKIDAISGIMEKE